MLKLEIDEKFKELSYLYDLFENITRIDYVPMEYRKEIKQLLIKAYKDGNQEFEKIHEKLKRLEQLEKENQELKEYSFLLELSKQHEESKNEKLKNAIEIAKNIIDWKHKIYYWYEHNFITKAEYDLLKEVLEDDNY